MKKLAILILVVATSLLFVVACGNNRVVVEEFDTVSIEEARAHGRAVGEAAGFDMTDVPSWDEIAAAREADPNHPECYWISEGLLHVVVDGVGEDLTPEEAVQKYGRDEGFMREYIYLMADHPSINQ
jgi:hypothetical protein